MDLGQNKASAKAVASMSKGVDNMTQVIANQTSTTAGASQPAVNKTEPKPFGGLPRELRIKVYNFAILQIQPIEPMEATGESRKFKDAASPIITETDGVEHQRHPTAVHAFTSLLLTCKMLNQELLAKAEFYSVSVPCTMIE
ncbi:hypothetical protein BDP81DRAFT_390943 [Colletotrichum phormii]|uniref:Uncharacterized protein n=1 Tax=Colletotrichum phormii TaxID=359342 RepID=A0AAI9ZXX6_9PEZI|nr:uncharacterized protein BDP81DRAFT_390943 [Colletotrichum phormii]KAK1640213.1 hypothetical protein BDP81DRAFT_390943 [Colletotrichum phormii]